MCFSLFKDKYITNTCSLCFCVNMSVWSKMLMMFVLSFPPAASWISLRQTNAIFMYSKYHVCLHSVWLHLKPCVCLELQAGNSPTNLVNVCVVSLLLRSTLSYVRNVVFVSQNCHEMGKKALWGFGVGICCRKRGNFAWAKGASEFSHTALSATVVSENIACLTYRHWSLFCLL